MLGRIDILSLPDPIIVNALFEVRRSVEILDFKVRDYLLSGRDLIDDHYYKYKLVGMCEVEIERKIKLCKEVVASFS